MAPRSGRPRPLVARAGHAVGAVLALTALAGGLRGDIVVRGSDVLTGFILAEDDQGVKINIYWSQDARACYGDTLVPRNQAAKVVRQKRPPDDYFDRALALKPGDADGHAALAEWCKKTRRGAECEWHAQRALLAVKDHAGATKLLGAAKAKKFVEEHAGHAERTEPVLRELLKVDPQATDADAQRAAIKARLKGLPLAPSELTADRLYRSQQARRGLHEDLQMRMDVGTLKRCIYTLFVPKDYDPLRAYPLVMGLHGGGPGPNQGDDPVGSGKQTMPFYVADATARGYIVVCPDAIEAGWDGKSNEEFIDRLFREIVLTYRVDLRRVYLAGHSMGGIGTWRQGPRLCENLAAFSPNSGGSGNGYGRLAKTQTAVYMYHGSDDPRCPVQASRDAAKGLKQADCDFIYTELPDTGHAWPKECIAQAFDLFDRRRTFPTGDPMVFAHPSTAGFRLPPGIAPVASLEVLPVSMPEISDLGGLDLGKKPTTAHKGPSLKDLVEKLTKGGELGLEAAGELGAHEEKAKAVPAVVGLLTNKNEDTRKAAAVALGNIGEPKACKALGEAAREATMRPVRIAAITALGKIGGPESLPVLKGVLRWQAEWFDGVCGGDRTRADNWQWNRDEVALLYTALAPVADAETLVLVQRLVVDGMILRKLEVDWDKVAHADPASTRRRYVEDCAAFVGKAARPEGAAILDALARCPDDRLDAPAKRDAAISAARAALAASAAPAVPAGG